MPIATEAVLLDRHPFKSFDEIATFILPSGEIVACVVIGSLRITSKNSRQMTVGVKGTAEIFKARVAGKVSKLKKFTATEAISLEVAQSYSLGFALDLASTGVLGSDGYGFVNGAKRLVKRIGDDRCIIFLMVEAVKLLGAPLLLSRCTLCDRTDRLRLSFPAGGMKCPDHYERAVDGVTDLETTQLIIDVDRDGYKPLAKYVGSLAPAIKGMIVAVGSTTGVSSKTLRALSRSYRSVIRDQ